MSPRRAGPTTGAASVPAAAATRATRSNRLVRRPVATLHVRPLGASRDAARRPALHDILDGDVVAADLATAVDHGLPAGQDGGDEPGHDGGVLRGGILARPEDVEQPERDGREAAVTAERVEVVLRRQLASPVRGHGVRALVFAARQPRRRPVHGRRARQDHPPGTGSCRCLDDADRPAHVDGVDALGLVERLGDRGDRRQVEHDLRPLEARIDGRRVEHAGLHEAHLAPVARKPLDASGGQVVDDRDRVAACNERGHQVMPDEPGSAGDRHARQFHLRLPCRACLGQARATPAG